MTDELLEVEVGQLILVLERQQLLELGVREDVPAVLRVLKILRPDVGVDLTGHLGTGNKRALRATEELRQLVAYQSGLHEPTGRPGRALVLALARRLLRRLQVTLRLLLETLQLGHEGAHLLAHAVQLLKNSGVRRLVLRRLHLHLHLRFSNNRGGNSNSLSLRSSSSLLGHYTLIRCICLS